MSLVDLNPVCADCSRLGPEWASLNLGVVVCARCCSVHRTLGSCFSKIAPLEDVSTCLWKNQLFQILGNEQVNEIWEHSPTCGKSKPEANTDISALEQFIRSKYEKKAYVEPIDKSTAQKVLVEGVICGDVLACYWSLVHGAKADHIISQKMNEPTTLLHISAMSGQSRYYSELVELLLQHGASTFRKDGDGNIAAECARYSGFLDCAAQICCHQTSLFSALQMFLQEDLSWSGLTGQLSKNAVTKASQEAVIQLLADMHDEVERRYVHAVWMRSTENKSSLRESSLPVPFLPVNTAYPPLRQQARQKLALLDRNTFCIAICHTIFQALNLTREKSESNMIDPLAIMRLLLGRHGCNDDIAKEVVCAIRDGNSDISNISNEMEQPPISGLLDHRENGLDASTKTSEIEKGLCKQIEQQQEQINRLEGTVMELQSAVFALQELVLALAEETRAGGTARTVQDGLDNDEMI